MRRHRVRLIVRIGLAAAAVAALAATFAFVPGAATWPGWPVELFTLAMTAFMVNLVIPLPSAESSLIHIYTLSAALAYSPLPVVIAIGSGVIIGGIARSVWRDSPSFRDAPRRLRRDFGVSAPSSRERAGLVALEFAQQVAGLAAAATAYFLSGGRHPLTEFSPANNAALAAYLAAYFAVLLLTIWIDLKLRGEMPAQFFRANGVGLLAVQLLPVPFALVSALLNSVLGFTGYAMMGLSAAVTAVVIHKFARAHLEAGRRLREAAWLDKVIPIIRSSLDLDALLDTIYRQVAALFPVEHFYAALYDRESKTLSFPLIIQRGQRVNFPLGPMVNHLTDYVIRTGRPLLLPDDVAGALKKLGIEPGSGPPEAWLGVPVLAGERVVGCLAILKFIPGEPIASEALPLLVAVAEQAGAALENARVYEQAKQRVVELDALSRISTALTASLNPDRVLELICESAIRLFNAQKSALYLKSVDGLAIELAQAIGLSEKYTAASRALSLANDAERVEAFVDSKIAAVSDLTRGDLPTAFEELLAAEGIAAYVDAPLIAQGEVVGVITVYFEQPRQLRASELDVLRTFAVQAAQAAANSRLHAQTEQALARRVEQLEALERISRDLTATLDLQKVSDVILDHAMSFTNASAGRLYLAIEDIGGPRVLAARGYAPDIATSNERLTAGQSITSRTLSTGQIILVPDVRQDADYAGAAGNMLSQLSVPIRREDQVLGVITLESAKRAAFGQSEANLVAQLAAQAAVAIENARLFERVTESRDQLLAVLNSTREGVLVIGADGNVALVNPRIEEMWGIHREDLIGKNLDELLASGDLRLADKLGFSDAALLDLLANLKQGLAVTAPKQTYQAAGLPERHFERSGTPVLDEELRVIGWVIVLRDMTDQKELEAIRDELTAMIIHDLRSPMASILGSLKMIGDLVAPADQTGIAAQAVDMAERSGKKLLQLVDSLLDISKLESGKMRLEPKPLALYPVAATVVSDLLPVANQQRILLINEVPPNLILNIDQDKVERLLNNLVDNALKFTPIGGKITVRASRPDPASDYAPGFALCEVADTGPGIPDEDIERVFDRFVQVRGRLGRRRGSGLGLAFCKLAVEAHGGRIWAENRTDGGSVFKFTLPVAT